MKSKSSLSIIINHFSTWELMTQLKSQLSEIGSAASSLIKVSFYGSIPLKWTCLYLVGVVLTLTSFQSCCLQINDAKFVNLELNCDVPAFQVGRLLNESKLNSTTLLFVHATKVYTPILRMKRRISVLPTPHAKIMKFFPIWQHLPTDFFVHG